MPTLSSNHRAMPALRVLACLGVILLPWLLSLPAALAQQPLVLQLRWDHQFQFAGYYAALWQGYYDEAGLEVEIRSAFEDGQFLDTTEEVAAGRAHFGVGGADILQARDRGVPLVVLASIFQHSAAGWYARADTPLYSPADLVGKRVVRRLGDLIDVELLAVLKAEGISLDSFTTVPMTDGGYMQDLLDNRVDVVPGYAISAPFVAARRGIAFNRLRPAAYGIDFYGDSLFTHQDLLEENPERVERFVAASLRGWRYALENPQLMAERITRELPRHIVLSDLAGFNRFQTSAVARLMLYPTVEPGHTNPERWRTMERLLRDAQVLRNESPDLPLVYDPAARQRAEQLQLRSRLIAAVIAAIVVAVVAWLVTLRRTLHHLTRDLRRRRAQLEAIIHSMGDGLVIQDRNGRVQTINTMALSINNLQDEEHARQVFEGIRGPGQGYRLLDAGGREMPFEQWPLSRARRFEPFRDLEVTIIDEGSGRSWTTRCSGSPVRDTQGEIGLFAVTMQDITRQRQADAEIRALNSQLEQRVNSRTRELEAAREALEFANHRLNGIIEGSRDLIAALDRDFRFVAFNNAYREEFRKLFGRQIEIGMTLPRALEGLPQEQADTLEVWQRALDGEEFTLVREFGHGDERNVYEFTYRPIRDQRGNLLGASHLVRDITDRVLAEERSRRLNEELERLVTERTRELEEARRVADAANQAKSEFLANMSHEIRTPMTAIMGYADVLLAHVRDPDNRQCVETIKRNGHHLVEIVDDILDLSKIEAGKLEIERRRFSPEQVVADIHSLMEVRARERGVPLRVEYQGLIPATIESDPTRLRQVLANLVGNAIKFTERGWVRLVVRLLADDPAPRLEFQVIDTGIGIGPEQLERLFKPFSQADTSVTRRFGGTGLGLAICRRLVEMLGGEITVDSAPNQGSTFAFTVTTGSLAQVPLVEPGGEVKPPAATETVAVSRIDARILVVDDRHEIRMLIQHYLENAGARVFTARDGQAGVERVLRAETDGQPFDLVVMDMQMPVLDGYQATARLRGSGFRRPIIALTAAAMQGDREKCLAAGCDDYLSKPVDGFELVEHIARHLNRTGEEPGDPRPTDDDPKCRVLLVDDSEDACRATGMLLEMLKYTVSIAHSGREALERVVHFRPRAVVLDIGLPDLDGYQVLERMKALEGLEDTVFIALSGRGEEEDRERSRRAGFHHHLVKPAQISDLAALFPRSPG